MTIDLETPVNLDDYEQTRTPDTGELAELLTLAKGPGRNMNEFADLCGSSAAKFSRIANQKITKPLDKELLLTIAKNTDPDGGPYRDFTPMAKTNYMLHRLLVANGMVDKEFINKKKNNPFFGNTFLEDEDQFSRERKVKNIIMLSLLNRGYGIQNVVRFDKSAEVHELVNAHNRALFTLQVRGIEPRYHRFDVICLNDKYKVLRAGMEDKADPETGRDYVVEAEDFFKRKAFYFLGEVWEPEAFQKVKTTFVFDDRKLYEHVTDFFRDKKVNSWVSFMFVDICKEIVAEEWFMVRHDGKTMNSMFGEGGVAE